jgi:hypothetical protein
VNRLTVLAASAFTLGACTGSGQASLTGPSPTPRPSTSPAEASRPLDRVILTADLSEPPVAWELVATIPFGDGLKRLGLVTDPHHTPIPYLPRSFAVAPDGSFWILDVLNHRLAHYGPRGRYLGDVGGFKFDRFSPQPRDVLFSGGRMYVVEEDHLRAVLVTVEPGGALHRTHLYDQGQEVVVTMLFPDDRGVAGWIGGYADNPGAGPRGVARFAPPESGVQILLPGVPVPPDRFVDVEAPSDQELEVRLTSASRGSVLPLTVRVVTAARGGKQIPAVMGPNMEAVAGGEVALYVPISPARPGDAERYGGGPWLLRTAINGGPLVWERLPKPGISAEDQVRHLAAGPDGSLYLMVPTKAGERIYRRPG